MAKLAVVNAAIALTGVLALSACSGQQPETAPTPEAKTLTIHPESGLEVTDVTVKQGDKTHVFAAELAITPQQQAMGLMFRRQLGPDEAMLFPREPADIASFWMKNTVIPLDIIFIGTDGRIMNIARETVPYSTESVVADGLTSAVLEIPGGRAAELGIEPGAQVSW